MASASSCRFRPPDAAFRGAVDAVASCCAEACSRRVFRCKRPESIWGSDEGRWLVGSDGWCGLGAARRTAMLTRRSSSAKSPPSYGWSGSPSCAASPPATCGGVCPSSLRQSAGRRTRSATRGNLIQTTLSSLLGEDNQTQALTTKPNPQAAGRMRPTCAAQGRPVAPCTGLRART